VATPGRLLDLMSHRAIQLDRVEVFVLDEADRMLDMGFIHDIRRIVGKLPATRQTLFFSATMPREITELANSMLKDPVRVAVTPAATTVERIDQRVILVDRAAKSDLLAQLLRSEPIDRVLVFTRTKHGADKVVRALAKSQISSEAIHGNKSQNQRERVLAAFRTGKIRTLVATDIAARGIDVEGISHVVNFDLPNIPESYVHRIGRTARAGAEGVAISFCDGEERAYLRDIEKLIRIKIPSTDQRGVRHAAPPPVAGAVAGPVDGDAAPATDWSPHASPRANGHGKKQQQNRPRQNKPYQGRSEQGRSEQSRSEHSRSEQPRKPHAAQPQQARNGDQQEQPQRNGQNHQQARNGQHQPKSNGQHPRNGQHQQPRNGQHQQQPRNGQPHQPKRNGHQQDRSPSQPAGDGTIATVGFMKPTQRQKHHAGGLAARRSAR
jgi:ATP-dependent RNA helicase RhlE